MKAIHETKANVETAVLMGVYQGEENIESNLDELESLAKTAGIVAVGRAFQNIKEITPATLIGKGKVQELRELVKQTNANMVIFDCELSGSQISNLMDEVEAKIIDRSILILDIFAGRATTNEGKLQVKLAQLKYTLPRLSGISETSGRYGSGGVGMRGPGETKLELNRRIIKDSIFKLEEDLKKIKADRQSRYIKRESGRAKSVCIVGYTNAGKSTLMNLITKAGIYADDKLFATLETTTRNVWLEDNRQILLTDTVGFIDKLPHAFIEAFAATLEEVKFADLLIHVVDITNPQYKMQQEVVLKVIKELGAENIPIITVYNKIDSKKEAFEIPSDVLLISAKNNVGIDKLKNKISNMIFSKK